MTAGTWYWIILVIWVLFTGWSYFRDDPRLLKGANLVLIVLLILNGLMDAGSPLK